MKPHQKAVVTAGILMVLLGMSRHLDEHLRLFLRQDTGEDVLSALAANVRGDEALFAVLRTVSLCLPVWIAWSAILAWLGRRPLATVLVSTVSVLEPLLLAVGLSLFSLLSLVVSPSFPYGFNLPLTLAYEGAFSVLLLGGLMAVGVVSVSREVLEDRLGRSLRSVPQRVPRRWREALLFCGALVVFASLTPERFWVDGAGQGNAFMYYRIAAVVAGAGSFDIEHAEKAEAQASLVGFASRVPQMMVAYFRESSRLLAQMARAAMRGELYVGEVRARRANRMMFWGPQGGIYYINAPGPGLLLVPAYLIDRALNRWLRWDRQIAVMLLWHLIGALLVLEMFRAGQAVVPGSAAMLPAVFAALSVPVAFYTFHVYPELPAALALVYAFRKLWLEHEPTRRGILAASLALAFLPWLHQKYALAAAVLAGLAAARLLLPAPRGRDDRRRLAILAFPLVVSAFSLLVYHHSLTGSILPDATFRAVGRAATTPRNALRGLLGLFFDAENGLFVYAPLYLGGVVGIWSWYRKQRRVVVAAFLVALSYVLVIAAFPYWPGAVSSVARYILSVTPFAVLPMALVFRRAFNEGRVAGVCVILVAASLAIATSFHRDLIPSYFTQLFLERTLYSDPYQYLPRFDGAGLLGSGPAHGTKVGFVLGGVLLLALWLGRGTGGERAGESGPRFVSQSVLGVAAVLLTLTFAAAVLERLAPTEKEGPLFRDTRALDEGGEVAIALQGKYAFEGEGFWVPAGGATRFWLVSRRHLSHVTLTLDGGPVAHGAGVEQRGASPIDVRLQPGEPERLLVPLRRPYRYEGAEGRAWIYSFRIASDGGFVPREAGGGDDSRALGCYVTVTVS